MGTRGLNGHSGTLIESGADVNAQLQVGYYGSALAAAAAAAASRGNKEVVGLLIESGADVNAQLNLRPSPRLSMRLCCKILASRVTKLGVMRDKARHHTTCR